MEVGESKSVNVACDDAWGQRDENAYYVEKLSHFSGAILRFRSFFVSPFSRG